MTRRILVGFFAALFTLPGLAQKPPEIELGFKPDKVYSFGTPDNVNLFNGNLMLTVPIGLRYPVSSQMSYGLTLVYNSKAWDFWYDENRFSPGETAAWSKPNIRSNAGMGWRLSLGRLIPPTDASNIGYTQSYNKSWIYEGPGGDEHELTDATPTSAPTTSDGSYLRMRFVDATHREIQFPNGEVHTFAYERQKWRLRSMADVAGNTVTVNYAYVLSTSIVSQWIIGDGHGRQHVVYFTSSPYLMDTIDRGQIVDRIVMRGYGADVTYDFQYDDLRVDYTCGHTMPVDSSAYPDGPKEPRPMVTLLRSVTLPDGSKWTFDYYLTTGQECGSGLLKTVTLPTLGSTTYTYQQYTIPANNRCHDDGPANQSPGIATRSVGDKVWRYRQTLAKPTPFLGAEYDNKCGIRPADGEQDRYRPRPIFRWKRTSVIAPPHDGSDHTRTDHYFSLWRTADLEPDDLLNADDQQLFAYGYPATAGWPGRAEAARAPVPTQPTGDVDASDNAGATDARYIQEQTWTGCTSNGDCSVAGATLLRSTYVRYKNFVLLPSVLRHSLSQRILNEDDTGCGVTENDTCYSQTDYADWDGLGHMRTVTTSGNFKGAPTSVAYTGYIGIADPFDPNRKWITGRYTEQKRTMGTHRSRALFHFDANTGLLTRRRVLSNGSTQSTTDLHEEFQYSGGNLTRISSYGGDDPAFAVPAGSSDDLFQYAPPSSPQYRTDFLWSQGALQSQRAVNPVSGAPLPFKTRDYVRHPGTGLVTTSTGTDGLATSVSYTLWGAPASITPPGELATSYTYSRAVADSRAKVTAVRGDSTIVYEYDEWGRPAREQRTLPGAGCVQQIRSYDAFGHVVQESTWHPCTAPDSVTWHTFAYDELGRLVSSRGPDGATMSTYYIGRRLVERVAHVNAPSPTVVKTLEEYDGFGRLITVTENAGAVEQTERHVTAYEYDDADRLRKVTMGGQTRLFTYDGRGLLTSERHPEHGGNSVRYRDFDARGHARRRTLGADGSVFDTVTTFDAAERPTLVSHSGGRAIQQFAYDKGDYCTSDVCNGKLAAAARFHYDADLADPASGEFLAVTESYKYDPATGRPVRRDRTIGTTSQFTGGATFFFEQTWNDSGDIATLSYPCLAPLQCSPGGRRVVNHSYTNGVLTSVGSWAGAIKYSPDGTIHSVSHGTSGAVGQEVWSPDPFGLPRPASISAKTPAGATLWTTGAYAYDGSGNITTIGSKQFTYDALHRLTRWAETDPGGGSSWTSRSYDRYGNVLGDVIGFCGPNGTRCAETGAMARPISGTSNRYADTQYDAAGNVILDVYGRTFAYDSGNVLTRMSTQGREYRYLYSADGERVAAIERVDVGGVVRNKTTYTIRGFDNQLLSVWQSDPANGALTWVEDEIWRGRSLLAREHVSSGTSHYFLDHLGSPRAVTTATGALRGVQEFEPFGNGGTSDGGALQFTGHERDAAMIGDGTAFLPDYMHARYYDGMMGRFLSVDPVLDVKKTIRNPQIWNRYAYVANNPMRFVDPTGKYRCEASKDDCAAVEKAIQYLRTTATVALAAGKPEALRLMNAVAFFGKAGQRNGVVVTTAALADKANTEGKGLGPALRFMVTIDRGHLLNGLKSVDGRTDVANTFAHEAGHGIVRQRNSWDLFTSRQEWKQSESEALRYGGSVNSVLGLDSADKVWTNFDGWDSERIDALSEESANDAYGPP